MVHFNCKSKMYFIDFYDIYAWKTGSPQNKKKSRDLTKKNLAKFDFDHRTVTTSCFRTPTSSFRIFKNFVMSAGSVS